MDRQKRIDEINKRIKRFNRLSSKFEQKGYYEDMVIADREIIRLETEKKILTNIGKLMNKSERQC